MKRLAIVLLLLTPLYAQNSGVSFPNSQNIACTPDSGAAGICNDAGHLALYDVDGTIARFPFTGPAGPAGPPGSNGQAATIAVASTQTLPAGQAANVTNVGTTSAALLNFFIPQGMQGQTGQTGAQGPPGLIVGNTVIGSGSMSCAPAKGTVQSGFVCTFTNLTLKVISVK